MNILIPDEGGYIPPQPQQVRSEKKRGSIKLPFKKFLPIIGVLSFLVLVVGGILYLVKSKPEILGLAKPGENTANQADTQKYVNEVSRIMLLPTETPILAVVSDVEKKRDQLFFAKAENGDVILIYKSAKKAVLYRPSDKKIIEVGVVNEDTSGSVAGDNISVPSPTPIVIPETTVFIPEVTEIPIPSPSPTILIISPTESM